MLGELDGYIGGEASGIMGAVLSVKVSERGPGSPWGGGRGDGRA